MPTSRRLLNTVVLVGALCCFCQIAKGSTIVNVTLDTTPLVGHPAGPFYVVVALTDGSFVNDANNIASLNNFSFGGGSALGNPIEFGGASGSLEQGVSSVDNSFLSLFIEPFAPGLQLKFSLRLTSNDDAGETPDRLTFIVLDSSGVPLPTLAPNGDYFLGVDIRSTGSVFNVYGSDPSRFLSVGNPVTIGAPAVQLISRQTKTDAGAALQALLASERHQVDRELHDAIQHINASLAPELWSDDYHLTSEGSRVFEEEKQAVHELEEIDHLTPSLSHQLHSAESTLALVDRALVQTAVSDAQSVGAGGELLTRAQHEITRGDELASRGDYSGAIGHYWKGWIFVEARRSWSSPRD
jgi:hypothetical protein